ncbi:cytochrome oxidase maturation protein, cbb3-type [Anaeromyxobacter dehalogenans 2CP-1]|uniref:Cytochrome oxidase maturation protein, cbb3-type n=1 Tax=Anaeromyxobacter dehalogenans (strain ATCC BAA-258 / DSM 21875 / 2CP-1) TaxID=455488 RepID=B8JGL3_ANAD2|nr:cbb3-type cytochrome oxidase assembly protein CcoS [Anaeromyxobacter dehalogenans]ACL64684.1 cytochrome oxidase maturation protein, cbb3-type [Anaeromyxobacter dehalogenans 2CP-1]
MGTIGFLIVLSLSLGLAAWLFFLWSVKSGQYDDPEGPKYRMLDDDDEPTARPAPPPPEPRAPDRER